MESLEAQLITAGAILDLASAIAYLAWAVASLTVAVLGGYLMALRKAKP